MVLLMADDGGLSRLQRKLGLIPDQVKVSIQTSLQQSGQELVGYAQALVPVESGTLRASIRLHTAGQIVPGQSIGAAERTVPDNQVVVTAGDADAYYARWVEFGTADAPAHPFLFPAFRALRTRIKRRTQRAVRAAVQGVKDPA